MSCIEISDGVIVCGDFGHGHSFIVKLRNARKHKWALMHQPTSLWYEPMIIKRFDSYSAARTAWKRHPRHFTKQEHRAWVRAALEQL